MNSDGKLDIYSYKGPADPKVLEKLRKDKNMSIAQGKIKKN